MRRLLTLSSLIFLVSLCTSIPVLARGGEAKALVSTVKVHSSKMNRDIDNIVILPKQYNDTVAYYPVVYLLHGYGGNHTSWLKVTKKSLEEEASRWNMIIVCPNGENSWYWDSPINPSSQFETYVSKELTGYIDSQYRTVASASARAVTGFSMGGHGGLWLGIRHTDVFGVCGSLSGGVDIRPFPKNWDMEKQLGAQASNAEVWNNHTVIKLVEKLPKENMPAIIIDCGENDFFYGVNQQLHGELILRNIPHDYIIRPGAHDHAYWNNAIDYQLMFFSKFFNKK